MSTRRARKDNARLAWHQCPSCHRFTRTTEYAAYRACDGCMMNWLVPAQRKAPEPPTVHCRNCGHELWSGRCPMCREHDAETVGLHAMPALCGAITVMRDRLDPIDGGKLRTCERPVGHAGRHRAHYCGRPRYWAEANGFSPPGQPQSRCARCGQYTSHPAEKTGTLSWCDACFHRWLTASFANVD